MESTQYYKLKLIINKVSETIEYLRLMGVKNTTVQHINNYDKSEKFWL